MIQFNCPLMQKLKTISIQRRPGTWKHQARVSSTQNSPCTFPPSKVESSVPMMPIKPSCRNNHHIIDGCSLRGAQVLLFAEIISKRGDNGQ
jgi:hypothetical protein